ncbi:MAG: RimK/LysX family protein [Spirulinaceae cyanobacterium]
MRNLHKKKTVFVIAKVSAIAVSLLFTSGCSSQETKASNESFQEAKRVGWIENAQILGVEGQTKVKLDTGAKTTSINAEILEKPENESESGGMIKFRFVDGETSAIFERPVIRWVKIKDGEGGFFRRPVVSMKLCIAGRWVEEEVNLAERDQFTYPVLIGRNMLEKGALVIDSAETFTAKPECSQGEG